MNARQTTTLVFASLLCLVSCRVGHAYLVGPALTIEKLVEKSDFVCKAVVVSSKPIEDPWFEKHSGFGAEQTELKIVEVYKGAKLTKASFQHYAPAPRPEPWFYSPQYYKLDTGRTYLIFSAKTDREGLFRQVTKHHTVQEDQGVLLAADALHPDKTMKQIFWLELTGLLQSANPDDIKYAIQHLNRMSHGRDQLEPVEFPREDVLKLLLPLLSYKDESVAYEAISAISTNNPMMNQDYAPGWLATVGNGHIPGYSTWDNKPNLGGQFYWKELAALVDSSTVPQARSLAIRALGRAQLPEIRPLALKWLRDADPQVAQSAILLLSDYLQPADAPLMKQLASDPRESVRIGVATSIGYAQATELLPVLGELVNDKSEKVAAAASLSLLSFALDDSEELLKANLKHPRFGPLFVNALAQQYGLSYADELCDIIQSNPNPDGWWGGFVIWGDSWNVLFEAAQSATREELSGKKFAKILAALEVPASGDPKAPTFYSSSEPRDLYALYLQKGMKDRAQEFRTNAKKAIRYDIDYYFNQVDQNPEMYVRGQ